MDLTVRLDAFEGPLDLLLHLITKHQIDIFDIPIHFITRRFLEAVADMQQLDLDVGGEYLVMAATLAQIKSRMLLPRPEPAGEEEPFDPREDLVRQLIEYQRYKELASQLEERPMLGRDVFSRPSNPPLERPTGAAAIEAPGLFHLLDAFEAVKKRAKLGSELRVRVERRSVLEEMRRIAGLLSRFKRRTFWQLVELEGQAERDLANLVAAFLAVLELVRRGLVRVSQSSGSRGDLVVRAQVADLERVVAEIG
ncbi:MAG: segregation/condensation protein A [Bradymonadales bacterium]|nr:segregation/condensation protein A [Bradymonadales bacterium]